MMPVELVATNSTGRQEAVCPLGPWDRGREQGPACFPL